MKLNLLVLTLFLSALSADAFSAAGNRPAKRPADEAAYEERAAKLARTDSEKPKEMGATSAHAAAKPTAGKVRNAIVIDKETLAANSRQFFNAIDGKDIPKITRMLDENMFDVNFRKDEHELSALDRAVINEDVHLAQLLIDRGAELTCGDMPVTHLTPPLAPLHHAAYTCTDNKMLALLIKAGTPIDVVALDGLTPLLLAAQRDYDDAALFLIHHGANVNAKSLTGSTALHEAVQTENMPILEALCTARADINAKDRKGNTPLHTAARRGKIKSVRFLVSAGADASLRNVANQTAAEIASTAEICAIIAQYQPQLAPAAAPSADPGRDSSLHIAAFAGNIRNVLKLLANSRINVNETDAYGNTPLHVAAREGHPDVALALISRGGDTTIKNLRGQTALEVASTQKIRTMIEESQAPADDFAGTAN